MLLHIVSMIVWPQSVIFSLKVRDRMNMTIQQEERLIGKVLNQMERDVLNHKLEIQKNIG